MSAESKGKWGALAAALVLLLGGGTGGFFLGKAQTLKQQQQVIDVQDYTTIYATISQISGGKVRADGLEVNDINGRGSFSFTLSEDTPITWHHTKIALSALQKGYNIAITYTGGTKETYPVQLEQVVKVEVLNDTI